MGPDHRGGAELGMTGRGEAGRPIAAELFRREGKTVREGSVLSTAMRQIFQRGPVYWNTGRRCSSGMELACSATIMSV